MNYLGQSDDERLEIRSEVMDVPRPGLESHKWGQNRTVLTRE